MREFVFYLLLIELSLGFHDYPSFFSENEINHHIRHERNDPASVPCNEDTLMNFLAEIQVINPESIIKLATLSQIEPACTKVAENLEKIKKYLKGCTPPNQPDLYYQLIKGVESLHDKLCSETPFKKKFQTVHKCLHEMKTDLEDCDGPADWNENSDNAAVCKAYKDIADCYYIKTAKVCGTDAAVTTKELLEAIIDSILTIDCSNVKANPEVKDPMPPAYIKAHGSEGYSFRADLFTIILFLVLEIYLIN